MLELAKTDTAMIIDDFDVWVTNRKLDNHITALNNIDPPITDFEGAARIQGHFKGFMLAPVACVEGTAVAAKQRVITDFAEVAALDQEAGDKYLLDFTYIPSRPSYTKLDENGSTVPAETPVWTNPHWKLRFGVHNK